jgi:indoleamine 2,3-dioxygenase
MTLVIETHQLTRYFNDFCAVGGMPAEHRAVIERVEALPDLRSMVEERVCYEALEALATFREAHFELAQEYIARRVDDPLSTGGTPYPEWLGQLIAETRAHKW